MKNKLWIFGIIGIVIVIAFFGCRKKNPEMPIPSTEPNVVTVIPEPIKESASTTITPTVSPEKVGAKINATAAQVAEPPSAEPTKPTNEEIQMALKNSGLYTGKIDGKIGPQTTKAIEDFQKQNNLLVDGKVGSKTWSLLKKYLTAPQKELSN